MLKYKTIYSSTTRLYLSSLLYTSDK